MKLNEQKINERIKENKLTIEISEYGFTGNVETTSETLSELASIALMVVSKVLYHCLERLGNRLDAYVHFFVAHQHCRRAYSTIDQCMYIFFFLLFDTNKTLEII